MKRRLASALFSREGICGLVQVLLNKDTFFCYDTPLVVALSFDVHFYAMAF